ncbi:MAG: sensor histidine kinase regulating citrate/malate metabolism, partial [Natronomonas sp.]
KQDDAIEVRADTANGAIDVEVACEDIDIPPAELSAFDDESERSTTYHPTGVRLWFTKSVIESYGGAVDYARTTEGGLRLTLTFRGTVDDAQTDPATVTRS